MYPTQQYEVQEIKLCTKSARRYSVYPCHCIHNIRTPSVASRLLTTATTAVVVVVLTLTHHHHNAVRGHRTGSNNSGGAEDCLRRRANKNRR